MQQRLTGNPSFHNRTDADGASPRPHYLLVHPLFALDSILLDVRWGRNWLVFLVG